MSTSKTAQRLGINAILALVSLAVCLALVELALRIVGFDPMGDLATGRSLILRVSRDPLRSFELTPNSSGHAWRTDVRINSYGMRDRERSIARAGAARIVVLGDSITFGSAVRQRDRFTDQLEIILAKQLGAPVEVLNFGVGGYDTLQEVATLQDEALRFSPDLVVLAYCVNDVGNYSPNLAYIRSLQNINPFLYWFRSVQFVRMTLDRLYLEHRLETDNQEKRFVARFGGQIAPISDDRQVSALRDELRKRMRDPDELPIKWYLSDSHLGKVNYALSWLQNIESKHDFDVVVVILPLIADREDYDVVYRLVAHLADLHGFQWINVWPSLPKTDIPSLRAQGTDIIHPSPRGHRLIAEIIAPTLARDLEKRIGSRFPDASDR